MAATGLLGFDEEQVDNFEIGGKFQTADRSFTLNAAAYVTKVGNMQREVNLADPGAGVVQNILNTADATIKGFEAEARMRVSPSLAFTANIGIIDAEYDEVIFDISGDGQINDADLALSLPRVPPITVGAGLIHELDLGSSNILTRINYQYRDEAAYTDDNLGWLNDLSNLEANITWNTPGGRPGAVALRAQPARPGAGRRRYAGSVRRPELDRRASALRRQPDRRHVLAADARPEYRDRGDVRVLMSL